MTQTTITTAVACHSCGRVGHCTRWSSAQHSWQNSMKRATGFLCSAGAPAWLRATDRLDREPPLAPSGASTSASSSSLRATLARLAVGGVLATPATVLLELDPLGIVPLRLVRLVVAAFAVGASER